MRILLQVRDLGLWGDAGSEITFQFNPQRGVLLLLYDKGHDAVFRFRENVNLYKFCSIASIHIYVKTITFVKRVYLSRNA